MILEDWATNPAEEQIHLRFALLVLESRQRFPQELEALYYKLTMAQQYPWMPGI